ncbi:transposase [Nonomuraea angiospora]|uniref:transposase n=1 Tax=Nonomuraea angiospora TaxID=46172 RepID=UPI0033FF5554
MLDGRIEERLKQLIREVIEEKGHGWWKSMSCPTMCTSWFEVDPQFGIHRLVKAITGRSSRVLREEFPHPKSRLPTLSTNSYFVATAGGAPLEVAKRYVEDQRNR